MSSIKDIKKIKFNDEYIFFGPESIVSEIADSMDIVDLRWYVAEDYFFRFEQDSEEFESKVEELGLDKEPELK